MKLFKSSVYNFKKIYSSSYAEERYVFNQLTKGLPRGEYAIINDLLLPNDGPIRTSQIDHLVISPYGIFCIETKSHKGWIFGSKASRIFTQVIYRSKYRISPNPVEQNNSHIKTVRLLLGNRLKAPIINIVVFPSAEKFFINGYENVGSVNDMMNSISEYEQKIYTYKEAKEIIEIVCEYNFKDTAEHMQHVERARAVHSRTL